jgi:hypothetical protein
MKIFPASDGLSGLTLFLVVLYHYFMKFKWVSLGWVIKSIIRCRYFLFPGDLIFASISYKYFESCFLKFKSK